MLESPLLPEAKGYVAGRWDDAGAMSTFDVIDPATGDRLATLPDMGAGGATAAIEAAVVAVRDSVAVKTRRRWLTRIAEALLREQDELARIITLENGKPVAEAKGEVQYAAQFFAYYAGGLGRLQPQELSDVIRGCRWTVHHRPAGVAALITPWNFPLAMLAKKFAAALAAGCASVIKPAEATPLTALALATLIDRELELPAGRFNVVIGEPAPIGEMLCTHPAVRLVSFTGSTDTGAKLAALAAPHIKRLAMELGGNAPFIVFADADLDLAADELMKNKFRAGGQTCVCTNRVYVAAEVADAFAKKVTQRADALKVGRGTDGADIGPLINRAGYDKVARHVRDAVEQGARVVHGGDASVQPPGPGAEHGCFYPPTVLAGMKPTMKIASEETFGPVVAVFEFGSEGEAIAAANRTIHGLAAYVFTADGERGRRVCDSLTFGHVGLNTATGPTAEAPFGGMKQSGFGREGGAEGLLEFCETQVVAAAAGA